MKRVSQLDPKLAIGLVLYFPDDKVMERIALMSSLGYKIFLFDNSPNDGTDRSHFLEHGGPIYMTGGSNLGLGYSLKVLCATAHAYGFERLLFLDQDTSVSGTTLLHISEFSAEAPPELQERYALFNFSGNTHQSTGIVDTTLAIGSGSLFVLQSLRKLGWHSEKYFVDCVDYEMCLRARQAGFRVGVIYNTPDFDHVSEQPDRVVALFGKNLPVRRYSASRIADSIKGYSRLFLKSISLFRFADAAVVSRSFSIYCFGQITSRLIATKPKHSVNAKV